MSNNEEINKLLDLAYFYLKFRPRTKKEVENYLHKKSQKHHLSSEVINKAIKELESQDLINDKKFIEWLVEQRNRSKQKSRFALTGELLRFGIDKDLIDEYFDNHLLNEEELANRALLSSWQRWQYLPKDKRFQKAVQFLMRRGFNFEVIKKTISRLDK